MQLLDMRGDALTRARTNEGNRRGLARHEDAMERDPKAKRSSARTGSFSHKDQATVWIGNVKLGHAVFPVKQISNSVMILESFHVFPQRMNAGNLDIDLGVFSHGSHYLFGGGLLDVDGLTIAFHY